MPHHTRLAEVETADVAARHPDAARRGVLSGKPAQFGRELRQLRNWIPSGTMALLDQGLISGSNFVLGVALARRGGPETYGAYMVMFGAFLLIANLYQALVLEPSNVFAFSLFPSSKGRYLRLLLRMHVIFSVLFAAAAGTILVLAPHVNIRGVLANAFAGFLLATPCILLFWLARCFAYLEFSPRRALAGSTAYFGITAGGLPIAYATGGLTPFRVFLCSACASCAASAFLLLHHRRHEPLMQKEPSLRDLWVRHWRYGRWGLGTVAISWAQTNSVSFTSGYFLGLSGLGGLNALVGLLLPMLQVLAAATRITFPRIAQRFALYGIESTQQPVLRVAATLTALTVAYSLVLAVAHRPLFRLIYGERFLSYAYLVPVMCIHLIAWGVITACEVGFGSIQQPQASFPIKLVMVAISIAASTAAAWRFGLPGVAVVVPVCSCVTAACMAVKLRAVWLQSHDLQPCHLQPRDRAEGAAS